MHVNFLNLIVAAVQKNVLVRREPTFNYLGVMGHHVGNLLSRGPGKIEFFVL